MRECLYACALRQRTRYLIVVWIMSMAMPATFAQRKKVSLRGTTETVRFGPMVPGRSGAPMSVVLPVSLSISSATAARGFGVSVLSDFSFAPTSPASGGTTMTASDIGIGVIDVSWASGLSGIVTVAAGFDRDPVASANGFRPLGSSQVRATLADLKSPREVVRVEKIPVKSTLRVAELRLTLKLAARGQYLTPGTFSGTITLVVPE